MAGSGIVIASATALSLTTGLKSSDQVSGTYQYIPPSNNGGALVLVAKSSATGINATVLINGMPLINDLPVIFTGTAGTISTNDNVVASAVVGGGRCELFFRNTSGGTLTVDALLTYTPF